MMLSRARPLALRTLTRQQRALSAAPQPVYEPHVVLHQRPDRKPAADAGRRTIGHGVGGRIFQNHPARRRRDPKPTSKHAMLPPRRQRIAATPPPRRQNSSAAHPATKTQVPQQKIDENGGLMEYSVVYTDRAMNHMSAPFQEVMNCVEIKFRAP